MDAALSTPPRQSCSSNGDSETEKFYDEVSSPGSCSSLSSITSLDEIGTNRIRINGIPLFPSSVPYEETVSQRLLSSSVSSSDDISFIAPAVPLLKKVLRKRRNKNVSFDVASCPKRRLAVGLNVAANNSSTASVPVRKGRQSSRNKKQSETDSFLPYGQLTTVMSESERLVNLSAKHFQMMEFYGSLVKSTRLLANHAILRFFQQYALPLHAIHDPVFVNMIFAIATTHESFHPNFPFPIVPSSSPSSSLSAAAPSIPFKQELFHHQQQDMEQQSASVNDALLMNHAAVDAADVVEESN
jgi:hypothetical protein